MTATAQAIGNVSPADLPELREMIEGARDAALAISGHADDSWETLNINWRDSKVSAVVSNLGKGSLGLTLDADTHSSNGVHSVASFEARVDDESGEVQEQWRADWTHPAPGSIFGHRAGDAALEQLQTSMTRFVDPIARGVVTVKVV